MIETKNGSNSSRSVKFERPPACSPATLLSPGDVQTAIAQGSVDFRNQFQGSWHLCGDASSEMYSLLAGRSRLEIATRVFGVETPTGARYGILCHQVQAYIHLFLLPLYEPRVGDFLLAMGTGRVAFQLGHDGSEEGTTLTTTTRVERELVPLLCLAGPLDRERARQAIGELPTVIGEISQPKRLPKVGPDPVSDVSVSVVLPKQTLARLLKASN